MVKLLIFFKVFTIEQNSICYDEFPSSHIQWCKVRTRIGVTLHGKRHAMISGITRDLSQGEKIS